MFGRDPLADPALVRRVYAYVAYRIGSGPDAEDVTSETFERALRYRHTYDRSKGELSAWLVGIARRTIDTRSRAAEPVDELDAVAPGDLEADTVRRVALAEAVSRLDDRERELIALRYGADLTARQIGELLEMRTNAVEVALHRALARLRAELEDAGAEELNLPA